MDPPSCVPSFKSLAQILFKKESEEWKRRQKQEYNLRSQRYKF